MLFYQFLKDYLTWNNIIQHKTARIAAVLGLFEEKHHKGIFTLRDSENAWISGLKPKTKVGLPEQVLPIDRNNTVTVV